MELCYPRRSSRFQAVVEPCTKSVTLAFTIVASLAASSREAPNPSCFGRIQSRWWSLPSSERMAGKAKTVSISPTNIGDTAGPGACLRQPHAPPGRWRHGCPIHLGLGAWRQGLARRGSPDSQHQRQRHHHARDDEDALHQRHLDAEDRLATIAKKVADCTTRRWVVAARRPRRRGRGRGGRGARRDDRHGLVAARVVVRGEGDDVRGRYRSYRSRDRLGATDEIHHLAPGGPPGTGTRVDSKKNVSLTSRAISARLSLRPLTP